MAEDVRWIMARRFEFIEWRTYWVGRVNRADIEDTFGVSTPQASVDLREYQAVAPENIEYSVKEKAYLPTKTFDPKFLKVSADRYLLQLDALLNGAVQPGDTWFGSLPPASVMPTVKRSVKPEVLRNLLKAIEGRRQVEIEYLSFSSSKPRIIAPHSIASDGHRWHARAWCAQNIEFRDFVLTRIASIKDGGPATADPTHDIEWQTFVAMRIGPHSGLTETQRNAIEHDFGMSDGMLLLEVRAALVYYALRQLNLDLDDISAVPAARKQLSLLNRNEVELAVANAKNRSRSLQGGA